MYAKNVPICGPLLTQIFSFIFIVVLQHFASFSACLLFFHYNFETKIKKKVKIQIEDFFSDHYAYVTKIEKSESDLN